MTNGNLYIITFQAGSGLVLYFADFSEFGEVWILDGEYATKMPKEIAQEKVEELSRGDPENSFRYLEVQA